MSTLKEAVYELYAARYTKRFLIVEAKYGALHLHQEMADIVKNFEGLGLTELTENMKVLIKQTIDLHDTHMKMAGGLLHNLILGFKEQAMAISTRAPVPLLKDYHVGVSDVPSN